MFDSQTAGAPFLSFLHRSCALRPFWFLPLRTEDFPQVSYGAGMCCRASQASVPRLMGRTCS